MKPAYSLLSPWFIGGLLVLILNDAWLKAAFPGVLSGKLSDFAGLLVFPLFWMVFFPRFKFLIYLLTGLLFLVTAPIARPTDASRFPFCCMALILGGGYSFLW